MSEEDLLLLASALTAWCQSIPEYFGTYAIIDGKLVAMIGGKGDFTPLRSGIQTLVLRSRV